MADFWYVEPTHTIQNVDTTHITTLTHLWIVNFQAKDFALMILDITPHLCMLVRIFFSIRVTVDKYDLSTDS